jgi:hypothetical protein
MKDQLIGEEIKPDNQNIAPIHTEKKKHAGVKIVKKRKRKK